MTGLRRSYSVQIVFNVHNRVKLKTLTVMQSLDKLKIFKLKMDDGCSLNEAYHDRGSVKVVAV